MIMQKGLSYRREDDDSDDDDEDGDSDEDDSDENTEQIEAERAVYAQILAD